MIYCEFFSQEKHYQHVSDWWKFHKWPIIPLSHLPKTGIVVFSDEEPAVAGWIYRTDSAVCLLEWIVANPNVRKQKRSDSISRLIEEAKNIASQMGHSTIFISAKNEMLMTRLERHGFKRNDRSMTNLTFNLSNNKAVT